MDLEAALAGTSHKYESRLDIIKKHSETVWKKDSLILMKLHQTF